MSAPRFKPHPDYKDSGVEWLREISANWEVAPFFARYEVALWKTLDAKRVTGKALERCMRNVEVQWAAVATEDLPETAFEPCEHDRYLLRPDDLLID